MTDTTTMETASPALAVSMVGITKRFPGVIANDNVNLELAKGEVHALLGENGAGKSTLSNVLTGLYRPDAGEITVDGKRVEIASPGHAIELGIGMVHQHFRLVPTFSVAENIVLGQPGRYQRAEAERQVRELGERFSMPVNPSAKVWELSVGEQQRVEILKSLARNAKVLILDEPTAVLTPQEAESLFVTLRAMAEEGRTVVFISHKLDEVMAVSDRVTVLRDATSVAVVKTAETSARDLARLMVGREVVFHREDESARAVIDRSRPVLEVRGLSAVGDRGLEAVSEVDLTIHAGEIVAVCGVAGNGQRELAEAICGTRTRSQGSVSVDGAPTRGGDPRELIAAGLSYVPEDRTHVGLAASATIEDNLVLKSYRRPPMSRGPLLNRSAIRKNAVQLMETFGVKAPSPETPTRLLSGGNVQKVLLAREMSASPKVLVAAAPTRGLDVGAIETVRGHLLNAAREGLGVLLITEELEEALALADTIIVMFDGRVAGSLERHDADADAIGRLMGGLE
jgi:simple sugar transport system ATP-binding protein